MKYYIIAGEASGDLHGSNLIKALKKQDSDADIRCWGGDLMKAAGGDLVKHYKEMAFMGFLEVISNINQIFKNIAFCKEDISDFNPDVIVFIDYSGFNLRIASWAKKNKFRTNYYISPQIWASREGRIHKIKNDIDAMHVILPFEKEFYEKKHHYPVNFVGHPLIDAIGDIPRTSDKKFREENNLDLQKPIIALLPGSRKQEVQKMLTLMLSVTKSFPKFQFVIAGAPSLDLEFYQPFLKSSQVSLISNKTYDLLSLSYAALVTSGTATLETALFKIPQVVCYRANWISYQIAKRIITLKFISLVNLIMDKEVVKELIQGDLNTKNLTKELDKILNGPERKKQFEAYYELEKKLGGKGASEKAASLIIQSAQMDH
ncbi:MULTISPECIES: lipid-A-disaccharide synthase [Arenibacter]|jgi:lipid-A-disaccharide synthase|uniref:Lipid-A-disaccharide synthase n=1 Tax=Arenibacter algicola TaxID=616991 RepID=A0A221USI0_9FLAO|nr:MULTISPECIES: lipid-A-disaccharide synthase [Arenibacter]ASO04220.1 lipid-A-disaccharide synthase [Arenibacter algicola]MDX1758920.1 lipid-A-disaccharide synthase [Arenibacter algicola]GBF22358.1 lipid-A-disaccharide synthase [Arenibacter sp. NBRC 103722]|tara:strand:+ start:3762 stop:4886 length:1125 start_codon:yes stop_codon:yes gene_type:complete